MSAEFQPPAHSRAFEHLVASDDDLIGLIAYSLYKRDKRDFFVRWREQNGSLPQPDHLRAFATSVLTLGQEMRYRTAARDILDVYAQGVLEAERPLIERDAVTGRIEEAARRLEQAGRWNRQLPAVLVAAAIFAVLALGGIFFVRETGAEARSDPQTVSQVMTPGDGQ